VELVAVVWLVAVVVAAAAAVEEWEVLSAKSWVVVVVQV
jgi:hypothetical protein